jgi:hypothetical protein
MLAAAVIAITGAATSFTPAQAVTRAAPAVLDQAGPSAGIVQVHRRHRARGAHYHGYKHYRPHRRHHARRHRHYRPYAYYPKAYYPHYYRRPGVTFSFSFGGGHHGW